MIQTKICAHCKKEYTLNLKPSEWVSRRFCSITCVRLSMKGKDSWINKEGLKLGIGWNKGKKVNLSDEVRQKMSENGRRNILKETKEQRAFRIGKAYRTKIEKNIYKTMKVPNKGKSGAEIPSWLGDSASYSAMHKWILKHWKKTGVCEVCKQARTTQWANKDHTYVRSKKEDWLELCVSCHRKWDKTHNNKKL